MGSDLHGGNKSKVSSVTRLQICGISIKLLGSFITNGAWPWSRSSLCRRWRESQWFSSWWLNQWNLRFSLTPYCHQFQNCYGVRKAQHFYSSIIVGCHHFSGNGSFMIAATIPADFPRMSQSRENSWIWAEPSPEKSSCKGNVIGHVCVLVLWFISYFCLTHFTLG